MAHSDISKYLRPSNPVQEVSDSSGGKTYEYRGPAASIDPYIPAINDSWETGQIVSSVRRTPVENTAHIDLFISTVRPLNSGGSATVLGTSIEGESNELRWEQAQLPLIEHPAFGENLLSTAPDANLHIEHIMGWMAETSTTLRAQRKYRPLDSFGTPGAEVTVPAKSLAERYIKLIQIGRDSCTGKVPIWTRVRDVRSSQPDDGEDLFQLIEGTPPGLTAAWAENYKWMKTDTRPQRQGRRAKWKVVDEWTGFKRLFFDADELFTDEIDAIP